MTSAFPSVNELTWQEWRTTTCPMESADKSANRLSEGPFEQSEASGTLSTKDQPTRRMYYEHQLVFHRDRLPAALSDIPDEELRALFEQMLGATDLCSWSDFPLPCAGLPGFLHNKYDQTDEVGQIICIGLEYLEAVVRNERRTMHLRWREAKELIQKIHWAERKAAEDRFVATEIERGRERETIAIANEQAQLVYFIGSASGPIKIGIAVNPQNRLRGLQTGHHEKLKLLATREGGQPQERQYHETFAAQRLSGEWFERCPEIEAEIARLNAQAPGGSQ